MVLTVWHKNLPLLIDAVQVNWLNLVIQTKRKIFHLKVHKVSLICSVKSWTLSRARSHQHAFKEFLVANSNSSFYSGLSLSHSVTSHFNSACKFATRGFQTLFYILYTSSTWNVALMSIMDMEQWSKHGLASKKTIKCFQVSSQTARSPY